MISSLRCDLGIRSPALISMRVTGLYWQREAGEGSHSRLPLDHRSLTFLAEHFFLIFQVRMKTCKTRREKKKKKTLSARSLITRASAFQVTISCSPAVTFKNYSLLWAQIVPSHPRALFRNSFSDIIDPRGQCEGWVFRHSFVSLVAAGVLCVHPCVCTHVCECECTRACVSV